MSKLNFCEQNLIGVVESVDTGSVVVVVEDDERLKTLQVNQLIAVQSTRLNQYLVGLVSRIVRKTIPCDTSIENLPILYNTIKLSLIGTHYAVLGLDRNIFKRSLAVVPTINAECYLIDGDNLKFFMRAVSTISSESENALELGYYSIDDDATAWINGNKFFQRHAVIVGSTGSGKSWCVAKVLEQISLLNSANAILFDIHGEYSTLIGSGFKHFKIAGPNDVLDSNTLFLPFWLLTYDEMLSLMLDRSDTNAPNQAMAFSSSVIEQKRLYLTNNGMAALAAVITIDSPIPYSISDLYQDLQELDTEMVAGAKQGTEKQGPLNGKLVRFLQRLNAKIADKRLNFLFSSDEKLLEYGYMYQLCEKLMQPAKDQVGGIKIIDFSEVPSDILPLIVSLIARLIFSIQQWTAYEDRNPIAIFCDEAHLYIPSSVSSSIDQASLSTFERISKEGRKYGIGLVVISQRPSEVNRTVLSQSNNFIAMRLTNSDDQNVVRKLFPDNLGDFSEILPILDVGEAIIVGDASLLPSRIKISCPNMRPKSQTIDFWSIWAKKDSKYAIEKAVAALRQQSK